MARFKQISLSVLVGLVVGICITVVALTLILLIAEIWADPPQEKEKPVAGYGPNPFYFIGLAKASFIGLAYLLVSAIIGSIAGTLLSVRIYQRLGQGAQPPSGSTRAA